VRVVLCYCTFVWQCVSKVGFGCGSSCEAAEIHVILELSVRGFVDWRDVEELLLASVLNCLVPRKNVTILILSKLLP